MLQGINNRHDRPHGNSLAELTAARQDGRKHLLLACSGSVATIKLPEIIRALAPYEGRLSIRLVLTEPAKRFLAGQSAEQPTVSSLARLPCVDAVYDDSCEWEPPWVRGDAVLHIELRRWADLMVVAPMSANTLAAVVSGMSSSLLLSCIRAWDTDGSVDGTRKRIIVAVAMNTAMWRHPVTARQIRQLEEDWGVKDPAAGNGEAGDGAPEQESGWFEVIRPISKTLACGDVGDGAMASVETIVKTIEARLGLNKKSSQ